MTKPFVLCALAAFALLSPAATQARDHSPAPPPLSAADKAHVLSDKFTVVKTVKEIPAAVQKALGLPAKAPLNGMADAGKPFEESDMVSGKLPDRRLTLAAVNANYCLVYFQSGVYGCRQQGTLYRLSGYGYRQQVTLYRLIGGQAVSAWSVDFNAPKGLMTFAQLQAAIRQGKYRQSKY